MIQNWQQHIIPHVLTIRQSLLLLDRIGITYGVLFVVDDEKRLIGSVTDGDIRRGLLNNSLLDDAISNVMFKNFRSFHKDHVDPVKAEAYLQYGIKYVPLLNDKGQIVELIDLDSYGNKLAVDAVIMAGGKGERLLPLTKETPKPLLKVGDKPIIEHNIDRFIKYGIQNVFISVNYLAEKIESYFGDGQSKGINIQYLREDRPLGTIGVLMGKSSIFQSEDIIVINSDLLTNIDYKALYRTFKETEADMAVATIPHDIDLPYAILEVDDNTVVSLKEKPRYTYFANAGIYILKKNVIGLIPDNGKFDATELMETVIAKDMKLVQFPILEYWLDIGRFSDYEKAQEDIKKINF